MDMLMYMYVCLHEYAHRYSYSFTVHPHTRMFKVSISDFLISKCQHKVGKEAK